MHHCIALAYLIAFTVSLPQVCVWTMYYPVPHWGQCVDVWQRREFEKLVPVDDELHAHAPNIYQIYSTMVMFWVPATAIMVFLTGFVAILL